jgi:hypothetical protein
MNLTSEEQQHLLEAADRIVAAGRLKVDDLIDAMEIVAALANHSSGLNLLVSVAMNHNQLVVLHLTSELGIDGLAERLVSKGITFPPREDLVKAQKLTIEEKMKQWGLAS